MREPRRAQTILLIIPGLSPAKLPAHSLCNDIFLQSKRFQDTVSGDMSSRQAGRFGGAIRVCPNRTRLKMPLTFRGLYNDTCALARLDFISPSLDKCRLWRRAFCCLSVAAVLYDGLATSGETRQQNESICHHSHFPHLHQQGEHTNCCAASGLFQVCDRPC